MEPNSVAAGGVYSAVQPGSMLGLEMSLRRPPTQNPHLPQIVNFAHGQDEDSFAHPISGKPKNQAFTLSDDEDPAENSPDDGKKKASPPWQRMKWTDNMVRLLIMVVFYIGVEVVSEAHSDPNSNCKKKGGGTAAGALQKKGKWKSVSRAMMERGFYVSPQQCEDKFNDLNKRYKRVNDILGKGISCRVVENQTILDSMDHVSPKLKEEVKKLLNSKHLFFREMCAYHNSCSHAGAPAAADPPPRPPQGCLHNGNDTHNNVDSEENADSDADSDSDEHEDTEYSSKRVKRDSPGSIQQLDSEATSVLQDPAKGSGEKRRWMRAKLVRLEEEKLGIQTRTLEIEKQRLKWLKFSGKKEREMEREKLGNERLRLENDRMVLIVRQKELDLIELQQHSSNRKSDPSSVTG